MFTVDLKNQPGELARLCEAMAGRSVNLILSATSRGEDATVAFIVDDEARAETALVGAGIEYAKHPAGLLTAQTGPDAAQRVVRDRGQLEFLCGQHHRGEGACIIDCPSECRWNRPMRLVWLVACTVRWVRGPGGVIR